MSERRERSVLVLGVGPTGAGLSLGATSYWRENRVRPLPSLCPAVRVRRIYDGATYISPGDELYGMLDAALVTLCGDERAAELLEPTA